MAARGAEGDNFSAAAYNIKVRMAARRRGAYYKESSDGRRQDAAPQGDAGRSPFMPGPPDRGNNKKDGGKK